MQEVAQAVFVAGVLVQPSYTVSVVYVSRVGETAGVESGREKEQNSERCSTTSGC